MAQLVKLENYISRYELDMFRYPARFARIKRKHWEQLNNDLETSMSEEERRFQFTENVFAFQLRWASSTLKRKSFMDDRYKRDRWLKFFLQQFPDNYLLLYRPVFLLKQAPVELEIIMIGPAAVWCVTLLEGNEGSVFQGSSKRFWHVIGGERREDVLNPLISNSRMSQIVPKLLNDHDDALPVRRVVLSPQSFIEYPEAPLDVQFYDRRNVNQWFEKIARQPSPLKYKQFKNAQRLLQRCQTVSVLRPE